MTSIIYKLYLNQYLKPSKSHSHSGRGMLPCWTPAPKRPERRVSLVVETFPHGGAASKAPRPAPHRGQAVRKLLFSIPLFFRVPHLFRSKHRSRWKTHLGLLSPPAVFPSLGSSLSLNVASLPNASKPSSPTIFKNVLKLFHKLIISSSIPLATLMSMKSWPSPRRPLPQQPSQAGRAYFLYAATHRPGAASRQYPSHCFAEQSPSWPPALPPVPWFWFIYLSSTYASSLTTVLGTSPP